MSAVLGIDGQPVSNAAQNATTGNVFITLTFAIFSPLLWQQNFSYAFDFIKPSPFAPPRTAALTYKFGFYGA
jgi:hypothetical protein